MAYRWCKEVAGGGSMNRLNWTAADLAEQAAHSIASNCLQAMLSSASQAFSGEAHKTALLDLQRLPHPKRAAGGVIAALVNVIEVGLKNLPKVAE